MNPHNQPLKFVRLVRAISIFIIALSGIALSSNAFALKFRTSHNVADVAVGDINGDGINDIVTCGVADNRSSVDVLLGNGDGTFQAPRESSVGPSPGAIALGDFNLDGHLDVVTANFGIDGGFSNTISVLLGYGDGTFQNRHDYVVGGKPNSVVAADLNADGYLDLVVGESAKFVVLLNVLSGFQVSSHIDLPNSSDSVTVGDINGDGILDVFVGISTDDASSTSLGNGDGTFQPRVTNGPPVLHPLLVDLNGDGFADLVGIISYATNNWSVFLNDGNGRFGQTTDTGFGADVDDFACGDFNNDGKTDCAITVKDAGGGNDFLYTRLGFGNGDFDLPLFSRVPVGNVIAAGLLNPDSNLDLVGGGGARLSVQTVYGHGDGLFGSQLPLF